MKGQAVVHSKGKDDWRTPAWLYKLLDEEFEFGLDAAACEDSALAMSYFSEEIDAMKYSWSGYGNVFVNPPYSLNAEFIQKAYEQSIEKRFPIVVCLIPSRTDTRFWHEYVMKAAEIRFIKGRLKFSDGGSEAINCAPFPSCVVIFDHENTTGSGPRISTIEQPKHGRHKPALVNADSSVPELR